MRIRKFEVTGFVHAKPLSRSGPGLSPALLFAAILFPTALVRAADYSVASPSGNISVTVSHLESAGTLAYRVTSGGKTVLETSALGIQTDKGDFSAGLVFAGKSDSVVDETYVLPVGKRSQYLNHANEIDLAFTKGGREMHVIFRAYDDAVAFRYAIPGADSIRISGESTTFALSSTTLNFWGMTHPNNYGYETPLGPINGTNAISMPALAELVDKKHFLCVAQAATYGDYIIPWFQRQGSVLRLMFPMDQKDPVTATLPFHTPWRVVIISPDSPAALVQSTVLENLNPPTEPDLVGADWIKPGRASWDFLAGGGADLKTWIDFDVKMGWNYHVADAGWETRVPDMPGVTAYGKQNGVGIIVWGKVANKTFLNSPENAEAWMSKLEGLGISGAKIDFFDQMDTTAAATLDYEDTQKRLRVRDFLSTTAIKHHLVVEFHGCAVPSGERRRWPNLMSAEAVSGMEHKQPNPIHELTIPYVRNIMGPVSFTPVNFVKSIGSYAYQLAQAVDYETGIQIFSDSPDHYAAFAGLDFMKIVPSAWDEIRFLQGYPASYAVFARRKGADWFVGGIFAQGKNAQVPLDFLHDGTSYTATIYRDGSSLQSMIVETKTVTGKDVLSLQTLAAGGFAIYLHPPVPPVDALRGEAGLAGRPAMAKALEFKTLGGLVALPKAWRGRNRQVSVFTLSGERVYRAVSNTDVIDLSGLIHCGQVLLIRLESAP